MNAHWYTDGEGQKTMMHEADPTRKLGRLFHTAEEMDLTADDIECLIALRPERYAPLRHYRPSLSRGQIKTDEGGHPRCTCGGQIHEKHASQTGSTLYVCECGSFRRSGL